MSLQISNLKQSNQLVELSIDEQTEVLGGYNPNDPYPYFEEATSSNLQPLINSNYQSALNEYTKRNYDISNKGEAVIFTPLPDVNGEYTLKETAFVVRGNKVGQLLPGQY